jgi:large subunit ribosomal protein L21
MYALVEINGKQYKAEKEKILKVDRFQQEPGAEMDFEKVLLVSGEKDIKVGTPYVKGAKVSTVVEENIKDKKIVVFKYKRRKGYRRTQGHRQQYTLLKVKDIIGA